MNIWYIYALLSALFAALTSVLAKIGIKGVDTNLATAIRIIFSLVFVWGIVIFTGAFRQTIQLSRTNLLFLILSGVATGLSWMFYFQALQSGPVSKVMSLDKLSLILAALLSALLLKEKLSLMSIGGIIVVIIGTVLVSLG